MEEAPKYPPPPPPAAKRLSRPKITLQIPTSPYAGPPSASRYSTPHKYVVHARTPEVRQFHPNFNPEWYLHMTQASDFIMNTAKSGLSFGEKSAFWIVSKLKHWSKRWFTHFFLMLWLVLYSVMGAGIFMYLEGGTEESQAKVPERKIEDIRRDFAKAITDLVLNDTIVKDENFTHIVPKLELYEKDVNDCLATRLKWNFINSMFYSGTIFTTIARYL